MIRFVRPVLLATALTMLASCGGTSEDTGAPEDDVEITAPVAGSENCPVRDHLAAEYNGRTRAGIEAPVDYAFLEAQRGGCLPVRYNPCEPIHYVVNAALAPPGAIDDLRE